jgi:DNA-directed RNA polymerase subunit M/transcription elongation factor TFIIS
MYYIRIDSENVNKLIYYCRNCGNEDKLLNVDNVSVSSTQIKKIEKSFDHIVNKYTKLDPTLPRISKVLCPNAECETNKGDAKREIIYIRYDDINMNYIYMCSSCDTIWKTDEQK